MFDLEVDHDLDELESDIEQLAKSISDLTEYWQEYVHPYLVDEVDLIFSDEPWVPLNPIYEEEKAREYPGKTILRRTDRLYESYLYGHVFGTGGVAEASEDNFEYGTDVPYAYYHEFGITPADGWGNLPKRAVIDTLLENREDIEDTLEYDFFRYLGKVSDLEIE